MAQDWKTSEGLEWEYYKINFLVFQQQKQFFDFVRKFQ